MPHKCATHNEWLMSNHYFCSCGHVEWAHYGSRLSKGRCAHCNCTQYNGEIRPLTDYEKEIAADREIDSKLAKTRGAYNEE